MNEFANLWYPDFVGLVYGNEKGQLIIAPYFDDKKKAKEVYEKIETWNSKFTRIRFIEYGQGQYAFVCYMNPMASSEKLNFGLYRSSMNQNQGYHKYKKQIKAGNVKLRLFYSKDVTNVSKFEPIGDGVTVSDCKILSERDLNQDDYALEKMAHQICKAR